ncbi:hypothetical protein G7046_g3161 [Stylonectria norvegica]|nr:hypothetical protein G7046_g3161 [Stylonectria norvegica]
MVRRGSLINNIRGVAFTAPWVLYLLAADVILSLLLPLKLVAPRAVYDASSKIAESVWLWIQIIFTRVNGARISFSGDSLPAGESAIVVVNHVGWCDFYMVQELAQRAGMLGRCRYFAKIQLRIVPFLGWGLWAMGMPLVSRNWLKDKVELDRVFSDMVERQFPTWLISFSEATRFTLVKYAESKAFCETANRRQPMHLLYPRTKGFITTVQHLRKTPHIKAVYDFTIAYQHEGIFQKGPSMWETLSVPGLSGVGVEAGYKFHVHVRRFAIESLPEKDEELATWLEQRWVEKGEWLETCGKMEGSLKLDKLTSLFVEPTRHAMTGRRGCCLKSLDVWWLRGFVAASLEEKMEGGDWPTSRLPRLLYHERNASNGATARPTIVHRDEAFGLNFLCPRDSSPFSWTPWTPWTLTATVRLDDDDFSVSAPTSSSSKRPKRLSIGPGPTSPSSLPSSSSSSPSPSSAVRDEGITHEGITLPHRRCPRPNEVPRQLETPSPATDLTDRHVFESRRSLVLAPLPDPESHHSRFRLPAAA